MFNMSGSEIIVILLLALVVLGPDKLPDAMRRAGKTVAELRRLGSSFQSEMRDTMDEPMREMRETANLLRGATDFRDTARKAVTGGMTATTTPAAATSTPAATTPAAATEPLATPTTPETASEESSAPATPPATTTEATAEPSAMAASPSLEEAVDAPATDTGPAVESPVERALRGESTIDRAGVGEDGTAPA